MEKKRHLILALCALLMLPMALTGCSHDDDDLYGAKSGAKKPGAKKPAASAAASDAAKPEASAASSEPAEAATPATEEKGE